MELALEPLYSRLRAHKIYGLLADADTVRLFMKTHIFAVWDFQSLLKSLQNHFTCVRVPWVPSADTVSRRLVNEIVLGEESDIDPQGGFASHYEIYLRAMEECGASTSPIREFVNQVEKGESVDKGLAGPEIPKGVKGFVSKTMEIVESEGAHKIAASFAYGREEAVPLMFLELVRQLSKQADGSWGTFLFYLERHIGLDSEEHGPQAKQLVMRACQGKPELWNEALEAAKQSLEARLELWDQFVEQLQDLDVGDS